METRRRPSIAVDQFPSVFKLRLELLSFQTGGLLDTVFIMLHLSDIKKLKVESIITALRLETIHLTFLKQMLSELLSAQEERMLLALVSL